jgi:hypothetical protein
VGYGKEAVNSLVTIEDVSLSSMRERYLRADRCATYKAAWIRFRTITITWRDRSRSPKAKWAKWWESVRKTAKVTKGWLAVRRHSQAFDVSERPGIESIAFFLIRRSGGDVVTQSHDLGFLLGGVGDVVDEGGNATFRRNQSFYKKYFLITHLQEPELPVGRPASAPTSVPMVTLVPIE